MSQRKEKNTIVEVKYTLFEQIKGLNFLGKSFKKIMEQLNLRKSCVYSALNKINHHLWKLSLCSLKHLVNHVEE